MSLHKPSILEEEYFVREQAEKVETRKRQEQEHIDQAAREAERQLHAAHCPGCGSAMKPVQFESLAVLRCKGCCGVFLDARAAHQVLHAKEPGYWSHMIHSLVAGWETEDC